MSNAELSEEFAQNLIEAQIRLAQLRDPVEQALANKALLQTAILDSPEDEVIFGNDKPTSLGIFRVFPTEAMIDWVSPSGELKIAAGQTYLDYHMPKSDDISNTTASEGYSQIAQYMKLQPGISHIIGVTYRVVAISARRNQGFNTEEIELPEKVMNYATAYWQNMMPDVKARQFQSAHIVWQDRTAFIDRFDS